MQDDRSDCSLLSPTSASITRAISTSRVGLLPSISHHYSDSEEEETTPTVNFDHCPSASEHECVIASKPHGIMQTPEKTTFEQMSTQDQPIN